MAWSPWTMGWWTDGDRARIASRRVERPRHEAGGQLPARARAEHAVGRWQRAAHPREDEVVTVAPHPQGIRPRTADAGLRRRDVHELPVVVAVGIALALRVHGV